MTFRRVMLFILVFALLLGCAALPAGAEHTHHWVDVPGTETPPTCTEPGWKVQSCSCGQTRDVKLPALGHSFSTKTYTGYADCTHYGIFYWTCSRCGYQSQGNDKPLGHDWDEGVITTPPQGFTPGVKTYTCKRDPSHTYTEEVAPEDWLFATLEGDFVFQGFTDGSFQLTNIPPLVIVKQPEGGYVGRETDEGFELSIEVKGGEPPYSYEWHQGYESQSLEDTATALANWLGGILGYSKDEIDAMMASEHDKVVGDDEPYCHVFEGGRRYWCEVTDNMKQHITSDEVIVGYKIGIQTQPGRFNLTEGSPAYLECKAYAGSGQYKYEWFKWNDTEGDDYYMGTEMPLPVTEAGEYYCIAIDAVTGDTAESADAIVYESAPLTIEVIDANQTLEPHEKGTLSVKVTGGVPPYEGKFGWPFHDALSTQVDDPSVEGAVFTAQTDEAGWYTFNVKDSMVNLASANLYRYNTPITIVRQPYGGTLASDKSGHEIYIEVSNCELPVTYSFYRNGISTGAVFEVDDYVADFTLYEPGVYYIVISDAIDRRTETDSFNVAENDFHVVEWTTAGAIKSNGEAARLEVKAEGGVEPYDYYWLIARPNVTDIVGKHEPYLWAKEPGDYFCVVVDSENKSTSSVFIPVTYSGTKPIIIVSPENRIRASRFPGGALDCSLHCEAITPSGDRVGLEYVWEMDVPGIGWETVSKGEWFYPEDPGRYRCRVTDTATGEYTYSIITLVQELITYHGIVQEESVIGNQLWRFYLAFDGVDGGPFTVQVYQRWKYYTPTNSFTTKDILIKEYKQNNIEYFSVDVPPNQVVGPDTVTPAEYYVIIFDDEHKYYAETEVFRYHG